MGAYDIMITAEMENVSTLQPMAGLHDPTFTYFFKLRCENCGVTTEKHSCVSLEVELLIPRKSRDFTNLVQKCKHCDRVGTVTLLPLSTSYSEEIPPPLSSADCKKRIYRALIGLNCFGLEPFDVCFFRSPWKVTSSSGTVFEGVDLSSGNWAEYDEDENQLVAVSNLKVKLKVVHRCQIYYHYYETRLPWEL